MKTFRNQIEVMEYYYNTGEDHVGQRFQTLFRAYVNDDGQIEYEVQDDMMWEIAKRSDSVIDGGAIIDFDEMILEGLFNEH